MKEDRIIHNFTDFGNRKWKDHLEGGKGDDLTPEDVDQDQLKIGIAVQGEHTSNPDIAAEISLDHISEDPSYYSKLIASGIADEPRAKDLYQELIDDYEKDKVGRILHDNLEGEEDFEQGEEDYDDLEDRGKDDETIDRDMTDVDDLGTDKSDDENFTENDMILDNEEEPEIKESYVLHYKSFINKNLKSL
jgi:hypothetical protein